MTSMLDQRAARVGAVLRDHVRRGRIPGGVVLVSDEDGVRVVAEGRLGLESGDAPIAPDSIMRVASVTKLATAVAALQLVDDGMLSLGSSVDRWLPELRSAAVARTPTSPVDDVTPLARAITVEDLLTSRAGWGFASDFRLPAVEALFDVQTDGRFPHAYPDAETWLRRLATVPLVAQPGEKWTYDTSLTVLGVLVERVTGQRLGERLAERIFEPLGMKDTSFVLRPTDWERFARLYRVAEDELVEADDRAVWLTAPRLELGNGGLLGTVTDWWRFGTMLLDGGHGPRGRILSEALVRRMLTDQIDEEQRADARVFLDGQGWGYGGSIDVADVEPWTVPGRFGWVGGTGTSVHLVPSSRTMTILMTQVMASGPGLTDVYRDVWTAAA